MRVRRGTVSQLSLLAAAQRPHTLNEARGLGKNTTRPLREDFGPVRRKLRKSCPAAHPQHFRAQIPRLHIGSLKAN